MSVSSHSAGLLQRPPYAAELGVDLGDHAVVERPDDAERRLVPVGNLAFGAGDELGLLLPGIFPGEVWVALRRCLERGLCAEGRAVIGIVHRVVGFGHDEGRMRADEGDMREPGVTPVLLAQPADELAGQKGRRRLVAGIDGRRSRDLGLARDLPDGGCREGRRGNRHRARQARTATASGARAGAGAW